MIHADCNIIWDSKPFKFPRGSHFFWSFSLLLHVSTVLPLRIRRRFWGPQRWWWDCCPGPEGLRGYPKWWGVYWLRWSGMWRCSLTLNDRKINFSSVFFIMCVLGWPSHCVWYDADWQEHKGRESQKNGARPSAGGSSGWLDQLY